MALDALPTALQKLLAAARWLVGPLALVAIALAGWHSRAPLSELLATAQAPWLIAACLLWAVLHALAPVFSWIVLRADGIAVGYPELLRVHVQRLPARYLPGGIWHTVTRMLDLSASGIERVALARLVVLENTLPLAVAAALGGFFICLANGPRMSGLAAILAGLAVLALAHFVLTRRGLHLQRALPWSCYLQLLALMTVYWLLAASAFDCYWQAFSAARAPVGAFEIFGIYLLAWSVGFVAIFAPQGLGVFEAVAGHFLQGDLGFAGAAVFVAGFRLIVLGADAASWLVLQAYTGARRGFARARR